MEKLRDAEAEGKTHKLHYSSNTSEVCYLVSRNLSFLINKNLSFLINKPHLPQLQLPVLNDIL